MDKQAWSKDGIIKVVNDYLRDGGGTKSSFSIQLHRHNGSDSPQVIMGDLAYDSRGLIFPGKTGAISFKYDSAGQVLSITPSDSSETFVIGGISTTDTFNIVKSIAKLTNQIGVTNTSLSTDTTMTITEGLAEFTSTASTSLTDGFTLKLPNNTTLPPTPVVGEICIYNGFLQVCETAGIWTQK